MKFFSTFFQQQILDNRARAWAGAGILTSWIRSRAKMERLHNTGYGAPNALKFLAILDLE